MKTPEQGERYARLARQELAALKGRIDKLRAKHDENSRARTFGTNLTAPAQTTDWNKVLADIKVRAKDVGAYLDELGRELRNTDIKQVGERLNNARETGAKRLADLRATGEQRWAEAEQRWSDLQAGVETGMWNLRAMVQRANEGMKPLLVRLGDDTGTTEYFFQKNPDGRWALRMKGASAPTKLFQTKQEGLKESRRYVRDRRPARLIVRRANGTFEKVHEYPE